MKVKSKGLAPEALCVFRKDSEAWLSVHQVWRLSRPGVKKHAFQDQANKGEEHSHIHCFSAQIQGFTLMYHGMYAWTAL